VLKSLRNRLSIVSLSLRNRFACVVAMEIAAQSTEHHAAQAHRMRSRYGNRCAVVSLLLNRFLYRYGNRIAVALLSLHNRCVVVMESLRNRIAIAAQSLRNRFVIVPTRPSPLAHLSSMITE
jgi:hypothetical protein